MRKLLIPRIQNWTNINSPKQIIKDLVLKHHVHISDEHIKLFENFKPEILLKELYLAHPETFNFDPDKKEGYFAQVYFRKLLQYLDIDDFVLLEAIQDEADQESYKLFYGRYNTLINTRNPMHKVFGKSKGKKETETYLARVPEVLLIMTKSMKDIKLYSPHYHKNSSIKFEPEIIYNNVKYVADSVVLANFNPGQCKKKHQIAGVTCNKKRYMYNGWMSQTNDPGKNRSNELHQKIPCSLMAHDWLDHTKGDFCINNKMCDLFYHSDQKLKRNEMCFSYTQGPRVYTYIRKDLLESARVFEKTKVDKIKVECPSDKILNPKTGRCVNKTGKIGKDLLKTNVEKPKIILKNECPSDKILNPKTGRCVNKTGKIGKDLLNAFSL
jgi:hypothetical protein